MFGLLIRPTGEISTLDAVEAGSVSAVRGQVGGELRGVPVPGEGLVFWGQGPVDPRVVLPVNPVATRVLYVLLPETVSDLQRARMVLRGDVVVTGAGADGGVSALSVVGSSLLRAAVAEFGVELAY